MNLKLIALLTGVALLAGCGRTPEVPRLTALEARVADLERSQIVERPFMGSISREEGGAVGRFTDSVVGIQRSGFLLSGVRFGTHNIAIDFTRGQETITKIVSFHTRLPER